MKLEELLNKLIELGWKPRGTNISKIEPSYNYHFSGEYSINDLCSLDSGLRQFVCEKGLYDYKHSYNTDYEITNTFLDSEVDCFVNDTYKKNHYKYRLMLSSIQEDKEKFILSNIILP